MSRRRYRKRRAASEEEEEEERESPSEDVQEDVSKKLEEAKEIQKFRKRPVGVSAVGLAFGKSFTEAEKLAPDPFKLKTGGLVELKELDPTELKEADDEVLQRLTSTFSAETNRRDDEKHMLDYIEKEMAKKTEEREKEEDEPSTYETKIKDLYKLPDRLNFKEKSRTEEMLSNQMLSGIPEIDLGLDAKFRNIEETELARQQMMEDMKQKKKGQASMAPRNMATNYTHHSLRFYKAKDGRNPPPPSKEQQEKAAAQQQQQQQPAYIPVVGENEPELKPTGPSESHKRKLDHSQMATDDYHYDKYRKKRHY